MLKTSKSTHKQKNQIILSKDYCLPRLIINETHEQSGHVGRENTLSLLPKHVWVVACKGLIKKDCIKCRQKFVKSNAPCMGNLPEKDFVTTQKSFSLTGIDYLVQ